MLVYHIFKICCKIVVVLAFLPVACYDEARSLCLYLEFVAKCIMVLRWETIRY